MTKVVTLTPSLLSANGRDNKKQHTCIVNVGIYRSGTSTLAEAFERLELKSYNRFPSLPPHQLKKILQEPQNAVREWYLTIGAKEILTLASEHDYISDGWIALLPFLPSSSLEELKLQAREANIQIKFVSTSRSVEETVKSELQHWVVHDLERQSELSLDERCRLEADLRVRALQHQRHVVHLSSLGLVKLLPLATKIEDTWPEALSVITKYSTDSWSKALTDVGVRNSNPPLPIEGILLTVRLQSDRKTEEIISSIARLLDQIEIDQVCRYLLVLGIDADERNSNSASKVIEHLKARIDSTPQMHSLRIVTNPLQQPDEPFAICQVWDKMAAEAWTHGADWVVLLGDDVEVNCPFHYRAFYSSFLEISKRLKVPFGFGCPFWNDTSFPGFCTFPCIGKIHFEIFGGLIPEHRKGSFVNQDLDPYLHHLYLRLGATPCVSDATLHNGVGGNIGCSDARYDRIPAEGWRDFVLDDFRDYIRPYMPMGTSEDITLDIVVPSFRVRLDYLKSICYLKVPARVRAHFIIIIDNIDALFRTAKDIQSVDCDITIPQAEDILERHLAMSGNVVRVRCNASNLGASASRNRGIDESAAEFILNLDDDLIPDADLLEQYGRKLLQIDDSVAGLVGLVRFPRSPDMPLRHAAVLMSYLTFMFEIAEREDMYTPAWGVTANILFRRTHIRFDPIYAKTGGGEDVDYSLRVTEACNGGRLLAVPKARVVHPFWPGSAFTLSSHFYNWAIGDSALFQRFPEYAYWSFPNLPETLLITLPLCLWMQVDLWQYFHFILFSIATDFFVDLICDDYHHRIAVVQGIGKDQVIKKRGHLFYFFAHILGNLYVLGLECGRLRGHIGRYALAHGMLRRFDWHIGRLPNACNNFRKREALKFFLFVAILLKMGFVM